MSATPAPGESLSLFSARESAAGPSAQWSPAGRAAAVTTLVVADALQLASHLGQPTLRSSRAALDWAATNSAAASLTKIFDILAVPFLLGTALVYVLLSRQRSPRLAYTGGAVLGCGLVGLAAIEGVESLAIVLAQDERTDMGGLAEAVDQAAGPAAVILLLLIVGGLVGTLSLSAALWRSGAVPRALAALVALPLLVDVFVNEALGIGPHWVPHAISALVTLWLAWVILTTKQPAGR
jgi:hypothetical protein